MKSADELPPHVAAAAAADDEEANGVLSQLRFGTESKANNWVKAIADWINFAELRDEWAEMNRELVRAHCTKAGSAAVSTSAGGGDAGSDNDEEEEEEEEEGEEQSLHDQWRQFKHRRANKIVHDARKPVLYLAGSAVKVDRDRVTAPTMQPVRDHVPGGSRGENTAVLTEVLGALSRRSSSRKRALSS
jgi:hypothetical protein